LEGGELNGLKQRNKKTWGTVPNLWEEGGRSRGTSGVQVGGREEEREKSTNPPKFDKTGAILKNNTGTPESLPFNECKMRKRPEGKIGEREGMLAKKEFRGKTNREVC